MLPQVFSVGFAAGSVLSRMGSNTQSNPKVSMFSWMWGFYLNPGKLERRESGGVEAREPLCKHPPCFGAAVGEFLPLSVLMFMLGRKFPMERKCWEETRASFLRALEDLDFGKKSSHYFPISSSLCVGVLKTTSKCCWPLLSTRDGFLPTPCWEKSNKMHQNPPQTFPESQFIHPHHLPRGCLILLQPRARVTSRGRASPSPRPFVGRGTVIQFPPNCTNKDELGLSSTGASDRFGVSHGRRSQRLNKTIMLMSNNTTASGN